MFFSPQGRELLKDPEVGESAELAFLDHYLQGWKNLADPGIDGRTGKPIQKFKLAVDDQVELPQAEIFEAQMLENKRALAGVEDIEGFQTMSEEEKDFARAIIQKHIGGSEIGSIGGLGTTGRTYPLDYADKSLAGTKIPVSFAPGEKQNRGLKLMLDKVGGVDPDTGAGLLGVEIDAMHREPAAVRPDLVTAVGNIKMGPTAQNQSDGKRTGEDLINSRKSRGMNLYDELFYSENGVPNKWRGKLDPQTQSDQTLATKMTQREIEQEFTNHQVNTLLEELRPMIGNVSERGPGDVNVILDY